MAEDESTRKEVSERENALRLETVGRAGIKRCDTVTLDKDGVASPYTRFYFDFEFPLQVFTPETGLKQPVKEYALLVDGVKTQFAKDGVVDVIRVVAGTSYVYMGVVRDLRGASYLNPGIFVEVPEK